jgi:hypothetical protein
MSDLLPTRLVRTRSGPVRFLAQTEEPMVALKIVLPEPVHDRLREMARERGWSLGLLIADVLTRSVSNGSQEE